MTPLSFSRPLLASVPLPPADPMGLPLPAAALQALACATLALHLMAMSFTLGGLILLLWAKLRKGPGHGDAAAFLGAGLPLGFSYLVTLGIPPLLFLQVLYGQLFYSSSVLVGAFWIAVVPLLIAAYALLYAHKLAKGARPWARIAMPLVALVAMLFVGFIYVNNLTLSMAPERWLDAYAADPAGRALNTADPTVLPRYLLFMSPPLAVAGLALVLAGALLRRWRGPKRGLPVATFGARGLLAGRVLTVAAGAWAFSSLPADIRALLLAGGAETVHLAAGVLFAVAATALGLLSARNGSVRLAVAALVIAFAEVASLAVLRDRIRLADLADRFSPADVPVHEQWGVFAIFAATLAIGLVFLIAVTRAVATRAIAGAKERWKQERSD